MAIRMPEFYVARKPRWRGMCESGESSSRVNMPMTDMPKLRPEPIQAAHRAGILVGLKTNLAVVVFVLLLGLGANLTSAAGVSTATASVTSAIAVAGLNAPEPG